MIRKYILYVVSKGKDASLISAHSSRPIPKSYTDFPHQQGYQRATSNHSDKPQKKTVMTLDGSHGEWRHSQCNEHFNEFWNNNNYGPVSLRWKVLEPALRFIYRSFLAFTSLGHPVWLTEPGFIIFPLIFLSPYVTQSHTDFLGLGVGVVVHVYMRVCAHACLCDPETKQSVKMCKCTKIMLRWTKE